MRFCICRCSKSCTVGAVGVSSFAFLEQLSHLRPLRLSYQGTPQGLIERQVLLAASRNGHLARLRLEWSHGWQEEEVKELLKGMPRLRALSLLHVYGAIHSLAFLDMPSLSNRYLAFGQQQLHTVSAHSARTGGPLS